MNNIEFDVLMGLAYHGIAFSTATACALFHKYGVTVDYCFDRQVADIKVFVAIVIADLANAEAKQQGFGTQMLEKIWHKSVLCNRRERKGSKMKRRCAF